MSYAFPLVSGVNKVDNKKICKKECGLFSYEFTSAENYCICDNGDTYNTKSGIYMFNINSALTDKVVSYRENNLDKFEDDLDKGMLENDLGKYLTFEQLMTMAVIDNDIKFDISWWNND